MLGHADGDELVICLRLVHLAIISDIDATALLQPRLLDALTCQLCLAWTEGDAICLHAIVLCGVDEQSAPATTDIQQTLSRLQPQLATKIIKLAFLCRLQVILRSCQVGTGVDHA